MNFEYDLPLEDLHAHAEERFKFHAEVAPHFRTRIREVSAQALAYLQGQL